MHNIKLIALDLDGTLLNNKKELSPENLAALKRAADAGVEIVPTTGRFYGGMPEFIRALPFINYAITVNGAQVYDVKNDKAVARAELSLEHALEVMEYMDGFDVIYDCYQDNWGYMTQSMWDAVNSYTPDEHFRGMVRSLRTPVPELKAFLKERGMGIQKTQLLTPDKELRTFLLEDMPKRFPFASVTSATAENIEINDKLANKGYAVSCLAGYLGLDIAQTASFGDGLNDVPMIKDCGVGIAMANACPEVLAAADYVTVSNEENGVARGFEYLGV